MSTAAQRGEHVNTMSSGEKADMITQMKGSKKEIRDKLKKMKASVFYSCHSLDPLSYAGHMGLWPVI